MTNALEELLKVIKATTNVDELAELLVDKLVATPSVPNENYYICKNKNGAIITKSEKIKAVYLTDECSTPLYEVFEKVLEYHNLKTNGVIAIDTLLEVQADKLIIKDDFANVSDNFVQIIKDAYAHYAANANSLTTYNPAPPAGVDQDKINDLINNLAATANSITPLLTEIDTLNNMAKLKEVLESDAKAITPLKVGVNVKDSAGNIAVFPVDYPVSNTLGLKEDEYNGLVDSFASINKYIIDFGTYVANRKNIILSLNNLNQNLVELYKAGNGFGLFEDPNTW